MNHAIFKSYFCILIIILISLFYFPDLTESAIAASSKVKNALHSAETDPDPDPVEALKSSKNPSKPKEPLKSKDDSRKRPRHFKEKCPANKLYTITSTSDLFTLQPELQCIFLAASSPAKVFEGPMLGEVYSTFNFRILNPILRRLWVGKHVTKIECQGVPTYLGWNKWLATPSFPFIAKLGSMNEGHFNPHPLYLDNKTSIILNYTVEIQTVCPDFFAARDKYENSNGSSSLVVQRDPWHKNMIPFNQIVDVIRPVGKQKDGGIIYLGQAWGIDIFRGDQQAIPLCYFSVVSYDQEAAPQMEYGQPLKPLEKDLYYRSINVLDALIAAQPLDNLLTEPLHVTKTLIKVIPTSVKNGWNMFTDYLSALGSEDARSLSNSLNSLKDSNKADEKEEGKIKIIKYLSETHDQELHSHFNEL